MGTGTQWMRGFGPWLVISTVPLLGQPAADLELKFFQAAADGNLAGIRDGLTQRIDVDTRNYSGGTALYFACANGRTEAVEFLLSRGAKVNVQDDMGVTPLYGAVYGGFTQVATILLNKGALVDIKTTAGSTPLMAAAERSYAPLVDLLLAKGANVSLSTIHGGTALLSATYQNNAEIVKRLLEKGADPNAKETKPGGAIATPVLVAVAAHYPHILDLMLQKGGDPNTRASDGSPALVYAAVTGDLSTVKVLLQGGADINATAPYWPAFAVPTEFIRRQSGPPAPEDQRSSTLGAPSRLTNLSALIAAAAQGQTEIVELLLAKGANPKAKANGLTALEIAKRNGREVTAAALQKYLDGRH